MSLKSIFLRDFVIVHALELDLSKGFTVLTGETGAGKSILIDALQLALGARADAAMVREGAQRCEISATFDCPASLANWLDENGLPAGEELLLKRTIDLQAKSRAWVNGSPGAQRKKHWTRPAAPKTVSNASKNAWPGKSAKSTSWGPAMTSGKNSTPSTAACPMRKHCAKLLKPRCKPCRMPRTAPVASSHGPRLHCRRKRISSRNSSPRWRFCKARWHRLKTLCTRSMAMPGTPSWSRNA